jgi:hypothetical protein
VAEISGLQKMYAVKNLERQCTYNDTLFPITRISVALYFFHNFRNETREKSFESVLIDKQKLLLVSLLNYISLSEIEE